MQRLHKGDTVQVLSGKDKGRRGKIANVFSQGERILVEGVNIAKRHMRQTQQARGGIVDMPLPLHQSKLMPVCPHCGKLTRVFIQQGTRRERRRTCGECEKVLDHQ